MRSPKAVLIAHDIRSIHNVGSLARTADSFGIRTIYATGITPYLEASPDERLPHVIRKTKEALHKTALGAEEHVKIVHAASIFDLFQDLRSQGYLIAALEQSDRSRPLNAIPQDMRIALLLGPEVTGLNQEILADVDAIFEIPMIGTKESLNVSVAGAIGMYELRRKRLY